MRSASALLVVMMVGAVVVADSPSNQRAPAAEEDGIYVYFSPNGGCTEAIVSALNAASKSVDIQAYSFTSAAIAKAVKDAHDRGIKVRVILDKSQRRERYTSATFLHNADIPVWIDDRHAIAHNKVMIIDGSTIITGSFNWSKAAEESNAENLLIIEGKAKLVAAYQSNFEAHLIHSKHYEGRE